MLEKLEQIWKHKISPCLNVTGGAVISLYAGKILHGFVKYVKFAAAWTLCRPWGKRAHAEGHLDVRILCVVCVALSVSGAEYAFKLSHNSFAPLFDHDAITLTPKTRARRPFGEGIPKMMEEGYNEFLPSVLPFSFAHHLHCAIVTQSANND